MLSATASRAPCPAGGGAIGTLVCLLLATPAVATNIGHANLGNIIDSLPETQQADEQLKVYQEQLSAEEERKVAALEEAARKLDDENRAGQLQPAQLEARIAKLKENENAILELRKENITKVQKKRAELLTPIIQRIEQAAKEVAREKGLELIFDTSLYNTVLFGEESIDVADAIRSKL